MRKKCFLITLILIVVVNCFSTFSFASSTAISVNSQSTADASASDVNVQSSGSNEQSTSNSSEINGQSTEINDVAEVSASDEPDEIDYSVNDINTSDVEVYAESACLIDVNTGKTLYSKSSSKKMYPASTTKLLTAIVVLERCQDLNAKAKVSYYAIHSVPYTYSIANLYANEEISINDLLYSLLVASANDSAFVLAEYIANGGNNYNTDSSSDTKASFTNSISVFSDMMNNKAKEIGCINSNFVNPNGIHNEDHYSTADDLALIGKYAYNMPEIMVIVGTTQYYLPHTDLYDKDRNYSTTNALLRSSKKTYYQYANGLKTGYTDAAQYCIIASAKKDDRSLICVVLHSENTTDSVTSREMDCIRLFEYGFNRYSNTTLSEKGNVSRTIKVINGTKESNDLNLICENNIDVLIKTGEVLDVTPTIKISKFLAPIAEGEVVGTITYVVDGITYTSNLTAEHDVYSSTYANFIYILAIAFAILLVIVVGLTKKKSRRKRNRKKNNGKFGGNKYVR